MIALSPSKFFICFGLTVNMRGWWASESSKLRPPKSIEACSSRFESPWSNTGGLTAATTAELTLIYIGKALWTSGSSWWSISLICVSSKPVSWLLPMLQLTLTAAANLRRSFRSKEIPLLIPLCSVLSDILELSWLASFNSLKD